MIKTQQAADQKTWLVTGGAGYIGAHVVRSLMDNGYQVVVVDDLSRGRAERLPAVVEFVQSSIGDLLQNSGALSGRIQGIVHLASLKNARESVEAPEVYWQSVYEGTREALTLASKIGAQNFVQSSSCSIFGSQTNVDEVSQPKPESPYGEAKLAAEELVKDFALNKWNRAMVLRYFNVVGNDSFPAARDDSRGHLVPSLVEAWSTGSRIRLYQAPGETRDGTCIRDYLDVRDIASAHALAADYLMDSPESGFHSLVNLSLGEGLSSLQIALLFQRLSQSREPLHELAPPRQGDPSSIVGSPPAKARSLLGWTPRFGIEESLSSVLRGSGQVEFAKGLPCDP